MTLLSSEVAVATAFDALYEREFGYVWSTLRRLGVASQDVEDLAQEVFVVVHRRLTDYDPSRPLRPWLFGVTYRVARDFLRRLGRRREVLSEGVDDLEQGDEASQHEIRQLVLSALGKLSLERRALLVLHDIDGTPIPEIADALGVPLNTVYSRLRLARQSFAAAIRELEGADNNE